MEAGNLIFTEIQHSRAPGQIETLRDDGSSFAEWVLREAKRHRTKERMPKRPGD
jgi:hypothetical protein